MLLTVERLKNIVREASRIVVDPRHAARDALRSDVRNVIATRIANGEITSNDALAGFIDELRDAVSAAALVSYDTWVHTCRATTRRRV